MYGCWFFGLDTNNQSYTNLKLQYLGGWQQDSPNKYLFPELQTVSLTAVMIGYKQTLHHLRSRKPKR